MHITFWGAARTVTGSQHLLDVSGSKVLLDCGLYQGKRVEAYAINQTLPFDARGVDAMVLSHAHIDHSGNIPNLVKSGFGGRVHATTATLDLCQSMLRDSAMIQESDVDYLRRRHKPYPPQAPIYTLADAERALHRFVSEDYAKPFAVTADVTAEFHDAGHMLGSAWELLTLRDGGREVRVCFSGDLGRRNLPILRDPEPMPEADYLIIESTYGDRLHDPIDTALGALLSTIRDAHRRGGKIVIPAFAVERSQELLHGLNQLSNAGKLPPVPIFLDSPLAVNVTDAFRRHPECFDAETQAILKSDHDGDPFMLPGLKYVRDVEDSKKINDIRGSAIIISASGMCETGRVLHHLRHTIEDEKNIILFVSFQAPHTLGRRILDGEPYVKILGDDYSVRADVRHIAAFSGHADRNDLLAWVKPQVRKLRGIFLVHGEIEPMKALAEGLDQLGAHNVTLPSRGQTFSLG